MALMMIKTHVGLISTSLLLFELEVALGLERDERRAAGHRGQRLAFLAGPGELSIQSFSNWGRCRLTRGI